MAMVFLQLEPIWVNLDTKSLPASRSGQKRSNFDIFPFWQIKIFSDAECPQESIGAICCPLRELELLKCVLLYDVAIGRNVVERNFAFGVKN